MSARRELLQFLSVGLTSGLLVPSKGYAAKPSEQSTKSSAHFRDSAVSTGWINFEMPDDRYIVLPVKLNNETAEVLLDSGVGSIALDLPLAAKLGLRPKEAFTGVGITGLAYGMKTQGPEVSIGNVVITVPEATVIDLSPVNIAASRPIVAILGSDAFDPLVVDIDFKNRKMAFSDPTKAAAIGEAVRLPLMPGQFSKREIRLSVEGHLPIPAIFDLGSDTPLYLSPQYVDRLHLLRNKRISTSLCAGVEGIQENRIAVVNVVEVGGTRIRHVPIETPTVWAQDVPAVVGVPVLSRFRLRTDFGRNSIWMRPESDAADRPFRKDRLGMAALPANDCLRIVHISPNSPASLAGLKVGDEIIAVDGIKVNAQFLQNRARQGIRPAGSVLHYRLRDGSNVTLTLADYF